MNRRPDPETGCGLLIIGVLSLLFLLLLVLFLSFLRVRGLPFPG